MVGNDGKLARFESGTLFEMFPLSRCFYNNLIQYRGIKADYSGAFLVCPEQAIKLLYPLMKLQLSWPCRVKCLPNLMLLCLARMQLVDPYLNKKSVCSNMMSVISVLFCSLALAGWSVKTCHLQSPECQGEQNCDLYKPQRTFSLILLNQTPSRDLMRGHQRAFVLE